MPPLLAAVSVAAATSSMSSHLLICGDQYLAVLDPLDYHRRVNERRCSAFCAGAWIASAALGGLSAADAAGLLGSGVASGAIVGSVITVAAFAAPFSLLVIFYAKIFVAARQNSMRTRRNSVCSANHVLDHGCCHHHHHHMHVGHQQHQGPRRCHTLSSFYEGDGNGQAPMKKSMPSSSLSFYGLHSLGSKLSRAASSARLSLTRKLHYGEETRAAKLSLLVLFMIAVCWAPFFLSLSRLIQLLNVPKLAVKALGCVALVLASTSPVATATLYGYRARRRLKRDIRRAFGLSPVPESYKQSWAVNGKKRKLLRKPSSFPHLSNEAHQIFGLGATEKLQRSRKNGIVMSHELNPMLAAMTTATAVSTRVAPEEEDEDEEEEERHFFPASFSSNSSTTAHTAIFTLGSDDAPDVLL